MKSANQIFTEISAVFAILFFAVSCNAPEHRPANDGDFKALIGKSSRLMNDFPDSSLTILRGLLMRQQGSDRTLNRGWTLNFIGASYDVKGMYDSAAHYLYRASALAEEIQNDSLLISVCKNLGILQFNLKNGAEAVKYYHRALELAEKLKDSVSIAQQLNNIGNACLTLTPEFKDAIPWFEQCIEIGLKTGYSDAVRVAGINLAMIYNKIDEPDKAIEEAHRLVRLYGSNTYADFTVAEACQKKKQHARAVSIYRNLLTRPMDTKEHRLEILKNLADEYKSLNGLDSAIVFLEKYHAEKDSLHNLNVEKEIQNLKIAYETGRKETQIVALQEEKRLILRLGIFAVALLLSALAAFFFLWRWTVQKKQLAEQQIRQIEQEKQLIATQSVLDGELQERTRLARDLHDGLGSMLTGVKFSLESLKCDTAFEGDEMKHFDNAMKILNDSMVEMRRIAHHLMPDSLARYGLKTALKDFCDTFPVIRFAWYGKDGRLDDRQEMIIYRIIHELVNNALKHSGATEITVNVMHGDNYIAITVFDNGCGFDVDGQKQGVGLQNIRKRVASCNGQMELYTDRGKGTEINIELRIEN